MAVQQKTSNNLDLYGPLSNYRHYNKKFYSNGMGTTILGSSQFPRSLPVSGSDRRWTITKDFDGRLDMIARKWYGGSDYMDLMWVLMLYNNKYDAFRDFRTGVEIYVPDRSTFEGRLT